jgi:DNA-binding response OmpR family regulator
MSCIQLFKQLSVLFVEDEQDLSHLLQQAIGELFGRFVLACDGFEGLEIARSIQPDLVITDITMPRMNGLEMSARLREERPRLPIVVLSAYSEKEYLFDAINVGVTKYLIKPFDPDDLLEVICTIMRKTHSLERVRLIEPFLFDVTSKKLFRHNVMVRLSIRENMFIDRLLSSPNQFLTNQEIKAFLWDDPNAPNERLRVFINRLRHKTHPDLIDNLVGQGYTLRLTAPERAQ